MEGNATWWYFDLYFDSFGPVLKCWLYKGNFLDWVRNIQAPQIKERFFLHVHNFFEDGNPYKEKDPSEWEIKVVDVPPAEEEIK